MIFGVIGFFISYFAFGAWIFKDKYHIKRLIPLTALGSAAIAGAHSLGRIGCLFAGCCHGAITDSWIGVYNAYLGEKTIPAQLFEAIFLAVLCTALLFLYFKGVNLGFSVYLISYGVWRFLAEYLRDDERGASLISFLSPSQLISLGIFIVGVLLAMFSKKIERILEKYAGK